MCCVDKTNKLYFCESIGAYSSVITLYFKTMIIETVRTKTKTLIGALISAHRAFARNTFNPGHSTFFMSRPGSSNSSPTLKYLLTVVFDEYI